MGVVDYLKKEYKRVFKDYENDEMQLHMFNCLKDVLEVVEKQGHSGFSINYFRGQLDKLLQFKPLGPITFNEDDFFECCEGSKQHKYDSSFFLGKNGEISTVEDCYFHCKKILREDFKFETSKYPDVFQGNTMKLVVTKEGVKVCRFTGVIKDIKTFSPQKPIKIECIQIEQPKEWWLTLVEESSLKEYENLYKIEWVPFEEYYKKEILGFKEGVYEQNILKAINIVCKELKSDV